MRICQSTRVEDERNTMWIDLERTRIVTGIHDQRVGIFMPNNLAGLLTVGGSGSISCSEQDKMIQSVK